MAKRASLFNQSMTRRDSLCSNNSSMTRKESVCSNDKATKNDSLFRRPSWSKTHRRRHSDEPNHTSTIQTLGGVYMCSVRDTEEGLSSVFPRKLKCFDDDIESTDLSGPLSSESSTSLLSNVSTWSITDDEYSNSFRYHPDIILEGVDTNVKASSDVMTAWKSSGDTHHHAGSPLIVLRSASQRLIDPERPGLVLGDDEVYRKVMLNARKLPKSMGGLASLHVILNNERIKHQIAPLQRMPPLDELAQAQAALMAANEELNHCNLNDLLQSLLEKDDTRVLRVGSNVSCCDGDVAKMHDRMMHESVSDRNNILDRRYTKMGVATRKASNGKLYVCQLFIG